jgi:poly(A) polymerase/tRNA nucleotidyltransferase (CCA-adding enzyme)
MMVRRLDPPPFAHDTALAAVWDALPQARVVGGAVRDTVAGRAVADIDLATPQPPEQVIVALRAAGLKTVPTGISHGTVSAICQGRGFEITTLRRDVSTDGRHATVVFTVDWRQDALRRDFTFNALSMTRDGQVFDYFGGLADLRDGKVRFVGDPAARIAEDYLRVLRFFRFHARFGRTPPDPATAALRAGIPHLAALSAERVWSEIRGLLAAPDPVSGVDLMWDLGILRAVAPEATQPRRLAALQAAGAPADPILRLAAVIPDDADRFAERLKLSGAERDRLLRLRTIPSPDPRDDDAALRRLLADYGRADLIDRTWLSDEATPALRQRLTALPEPVFPLEGRDVLALGIAPGPRVGALLRDVRQWWHGGGCVADRDACIQELTRRACTGV